jgi:hypothetical protein
LHRDGVTIFDASMFVDHAHLVGVLCARDGVFAWVIALDDGYHPFIIPSWF